MTVSGYRRKPLQQALMRSPSSLTVPTGLEAELNYPMLWRDGSICTFALITGRRIHIATHRINLEA